jgi:hypothetical protein
MTMWRLLAALSLAYFAGTTALDLIPHEVASQAACHIASTLGHHTRVLTQSFTEIG